MPEHAVRLAQKKTGNVLVRRFRADATLSEEEVGAGTKVDKGEGVGVQRSDLSLRSKVNFIQASEAGLLAILHRDESLPRERCQSSDTSRANTCSEVLGISLLHNLVEAHLEDLSSLVHVIDGFFQEGGHQHAHRGV